MEHLGILTNRAMCPCLAQSSLALEMILVLTGGFTGISSTVQPSPVPGISFDLRQEVAVSSSMGETGVQVAVLLV